MNKIFLIGGAPTAGKTNATQKLAEALSLPWISTDVIRSIMIKTVKKEDYPDLFYTTTANAENYLAGHSVEEIVADQNKESFSVWRGVETFIDARYSGDWDSCIIEGIAVLPSLVHEARSRVDWIYPVFLYEDREERIREVIFTRGLWDDADKYSDEVKEKEVLWVIAFNKFIKEEATKYGFPLVQYQDDGSHLEEIKKLFV